MARDKNRFKFRGPFRGLTTSQLANNDPSYFTASSNMETYDGRAKPRNGYTRYSAGARLQPSSNIMYAVTPVRSPYRDYDDLILVEGTAPLMFWRRVFLDTTTGQVDWARVSADTMNSSAGWSFSPTSYRKCSYNAGNRTYFVGGGDYVWCYEREAIYDANNNDGIEATGTATAGSSSTISLQQVGGTTSEDNTYTFMQCEIELTGGTGAGQVRQIASYDHTGGATERRVTVEQNWVTSPDNTTTYRIYRIWFRKAGLVAPTIGDFTISQANSTGTWTNGQEVSYRVSYYDTHTGLESNGSNATSIVIVAPADTITLKFTNDAAMPTTVYGNTGHAASPTGLVANRLRYYRQIVSSGETDWTFVGETSIDIGEDATSSALVDTVITAEASTVPVTHGVPHAGAFGCYHKGRAFISQVDGSGIHYSEADDPVYGLGAEYRYQPPFLLQSVEPIRWLQSMGNEMLIFQDRRCYRANTDGLPDDPFVSEILGMPGTPNGWTVAHATGGEYGSNIIYYANEVGIYSYDGAVARKISNPLSNSYSDTIFLMSDFYKLTGCYDPAYDRYLLTYSPAAAGPYGFYVFNARTQGWDVWTLYITGGVSAATVRSMVIASTLTGRRVLFMGFENGRSGYWSNPNTALVNTDDGNTIPWSFSTIQLDLDGDPTAKKHVHEATFAWRDGCGVTATISATGAGSTLKTSSSLLASTYLNTTPISIGADVRNLQLNMSGNVPASNNFWITGYSVTYSDAGQRG